MSIEQDVRVSTQRRSGLPAGLRTRDGRTARRTKRGKPESGLSPALLDFVDNCLVPILVKLYLESDCDSLPGVN
jgi:hypothetical protein